MSSRGRRGVRAFARLIAVVVATAAVSVGTGRAAGASPTYISGSFSLPSGVAVDATGRLYVAEPWSVERIDPDGTRTAIYNAFGAWGVAAEPDGTVYFSRPDSGDVLRITPSGETTTFAASLGTPLGVAVAPSGAIVVVDRGGVVRMFTDDGSLLRAWTPISGEDLHGVAVGPDGTLWITALVRGSSPRQMTLHAVDPTGAAAARTVLVSTLAHSLGVAVDAAGTVFLTQAATGLSDPAFCHGSVLRILPDGTQEVFGRELCEVFALAVGVDDTVYFVDDILGALGSIPEPFGIRYRALPSAVRGSAFAPIQLQAVGVIPSTAPLTTVVKFTKVSLPKGLRLSATGVLSGTPSARLTPGVYPVTVSVSEVVTTVIGNRRFKSRATGTRVLYVAVA